MSGTTSKSLIGALALTLASFMVVGCTGGAEPGKTEEKTVQAGTKGLEAQTTEMQPAPGAFEADKMVGSKSR